jgi:hypothetical protein
VRPIVLLALQDDDVRARFAYQLTALGFDVLTQVTVDLRNSCRPDVIVVELTAAQSGSAPSNGIASGERLRTIPVVAVADASATRRATSRVVTGAPPSVSPPVPRRHSPRGFTPSSADDRFAFDWRAADGGDRFDQCFGQPRTVCTDAHT